MLQIGQPCSKGKFSLILGFLDVKYQHFHPDIIACADIHSNENVFRSLSNSLKVPGYKIANSICMYESGF